MQRWKKEQIYPLLKKWKKSNQSKRDFCSIHGIKVSTFYYWLSKLGSDVVKNVFSCWTTEDVELSNSRITTTDIRSVDNFFEENRGKKYIINLSFDYNQKGTITNPLFSYRNADSKYALLR